MIPSAFIEQMRLTLGGEADAFFGALREEPLRGIRMTPGKHPGTPAGLGAPVPWFPGMYYLDSASDAGKHPLHEAGAYYLQEPSAAVPPAVLCPRDGELVLDLCAAPGGKATAMAAMAPGALIIANEIMPDRAKILSANAERLGMINLIVLNESPARLAQHWAGLFDAVLVDAPCSGEGMFRRHPETVAEWTPNSPDLCARRQHEILASAIQLVKPGGRLCYSTCTFNRRENEDQVARLIAEQPDFSPADFSVLGIGASIGGSLRVWPHHTRGEGHFAALLRRDAGDGAPSLRAVNAAGLPQPDRETRSAAEAFLSKLIDAPVSVDADFLGRLWQIPASAPDLRSLKVLRPGLALLYRQGKMLNPDHALSHAKAARQRVELTEEQAVKYLHGETLPCDSVLHGWCAVCFGGNALGWGKISQGTIKNHYPKGLRK